MQLVWFLFIGHLYVVLQLDHHEHPDSLHVVEFVIGLHRVSLAGLLALHPDESSQEGVVERQLGLSEQVELL